MKLFPAVGMCFAGLWDYLPHPRDHHDGEDEVGEEAGAGAETGEGLYTCTIITTESCKTLQFLHNRMPVIFELGGEEL